MVFFLRFLPWSLVCGSSDGVDGGGALSYAGFGYPLFYSILPSSTRIFYIYLCICFSLSPFLLTYVYTQLDQTVACSTKIV